MVFLRVDGVEFSYRSVDVLKNIKFGIHKGEIVSIVGPNGSGKTTLLKVINGILRPKKGSIYIDEKTFHSFSKRDIAKIIGYVPQKLVSQQPMAVLEFVVTGRKPYILFTPTRKDYEIAVEVLREVGMEDKANRKITELSGGELQMILIARALAAEPRVLLLDEPTSNLDPYHQIEIMNLVKKVAKERNVAVLTVLHDLTLAYRYSDKVIMMKRGEIFSLGSPEEVLTEENILHVYNVKAMVVHELRTIVFLDNIRKY